jgi:hypothetical protein
VATLSEYLNDTALLLRDSNYLFNSQTVLTRYINLARDQVAKQTGCLRALVAGQAPYGNAANPYNPLLPNAVGTSIPGATQPGSNIMQAFTTIAGVEKYSYGYATPFLKANYQGLRAIVDVIDVAVSWGGNRPSLNWLPWEELQAYCRSYNFLVTSYPFVWSSNGSGSKGQVWLFPVPQVTAPASNFTTTAPAGEMEWDCTCLPSYLYSNNDYDALPESVTDAVPFFAAHLAFLGSQRFGMAAIMKAEFNEKLGIDNTAGDRGKTDAYYWDEWS